MCFLVWLKLFVPKNSYLKMKLKGADQSWIKSPSLSMNVVKDYFFGLLKLSIDSS